MITARKSDRRGAVKAGLETAIVDLATGLPFYNRTSKQNGGSP
jgi:hypothetical protein